MNILITGGSGYLGRALCSFLDGLDHKVKVLERSSTNHDVDMVIGDITARDDMLKACEGVDCVIHLAALDMHACKENPELALKVNGFGTRNVISCAVEKGVSRFIYFSTIHTYGDLKGKIIESRVTRPFTDYGLTKLVGEKYCHQFSDSINLTILRLSNVYGAPVSGAGWNLATNAFCQSAIKDGKITLKSPGQQKRNFVNIKDIMQAVKLVLDSERPLVDGKLFNLGGKDLVSIAGLARLVADTAKEVYGRKVEVEIPPGKSDDFDFDFDFSRIQSIGYSPSVDIKDGIKELFKDASD